jgi:hypothetical protein
MTNQGTRYWGGEARPQRRLYAKIKRVAVLALASIGMMAGIGSWVVALGHDMPEFNLFTLGVGDQGSTTVFWAPSTNVRTIAGKELEECEACRVEIRMPKEFADAIRRTFEQDAYADYEKLEPPKVLRIVVVIGGSAARVCDYHWHDDYRHTHCN